MHHITPSTPDLRTSWRMAIGMGIFLPIAETVRRIHQVIELMDISAWIDDYILGAVLLYAAWLTQKSPERNGYYLIAAWGIACGALFLSLMGQFRYLGGEATEPGIFSAGLVLLAKALILAFMVVGLALSIKAYRQS